MNGLENQGATLDDVNVRESADSKRKDSNAETESVIIIQQVTTGGEDKINTAIPKSNKNTVKSNHKIVDINDNAANKKEKKDGTYSQRKDITRDDVKVVGWTFGLVSFIATFLTKPMPKLPYPFIGHLMDWDPTKVPIGWWDRQGLVVLFLWSWIYCRRLCIHVIRWCLFLKTTGTNEDKSTNNDIAKTSNSTKSKCRIIYFILLIFGNIFIGLWMGWANNFYLGYVPSDLEITVLGLAVFVLAEGVMIGIYGCVMVNKGANKRESIWLTAMEILSCVGLMLVSFTLPSCVLLLVRIPLGVYSVVAANKLF